MTYLTFYFRAKIRNQGKKEKRVRGEKEGGRKGEKGREEEEGREAEKRREGGEGKGTGGREEKSRMNEAIYKHSLNFYVLFSPGFQYARLYYLTIVPSQTL
jgi:hypothetical protein